MAKADEIFAATDLPPIKPGGGLCPLLPLSVWHIWQLQVLQSPYAVGGVITDQDRISAASLFMRTRAEWLALCDDAEAVQAEIIRLAGLFDDLPPSDMEAYRAYIDAHVGACTVWPEYWDDGKAKPLKCPFPWLVVRTLLSMRVCQTEAEAWDYHASRAMCWQAVDIEANGCKDYISQAEREKAKGLTDG